MHSNSSNNTSTYHERLALEGGHDPGGLGAVAAAGRIDADEEEGDGPVQADLVTDGTFDMGRVKARARAKVDDSAELACLVACAGLVKDAHGLSLEWIRLVHQLCP